MNIGVDDGGVPTHNLTSPNANLKRIAVNQKFTSKLRKHSTLIYREVAKGPPHLWISSSITITMALSLAYIVRAIPERLLMALMIGNRIDLVCMTVVAKLPLKSAGFCQDLNVSFLLLIEASNSSRVQDIQIELQQIN